VDAAQAEKEQLPINEQFAMDSAFDKLRALGATLPFPHQSNVAGAAGLRELRPRAGRSRWRALYARVGDAMVVVAIGREASVDRHGFNRAIRTAETRLAHYVQEQQRQQEGKP